MKTFIKGIYKRSIFSSEKGYIIGIIKVLETDNEKMEDYINKTVTFTGYFHELDEEENYIFYGEELDHPKYGMQFQVSEYERLKPQDKDGIIEFLSSDLFYSVGKKLATSIVETLGIETLDLILQDPSVLNLVPKLTQKKATIIYNTLSKYEESHQTIVYLNDLGFTMHDSLNIYNKYKNNTLDIIKNNIFKLIDEVDEISFPKIDEIIKKLNVDAEDDRRVKACIIYSMKNLLFKNGDTYLNYDEVYNATTNYLNILIDTELFENYIYDLTLENKIVVEDHKYFIKEMYDAEINIANKFVLLNAMTKSKYKKLDNYIEEMEHINNISYNEKQKKAIKSALENNSLIITGGPGTGKTTIINAIVELYIKLTNINYEEAVNQIALLAPTGRASKRLSEATAFPATTIHRFLKWNKEANEFAINEYNKNQSRLIIVDEVSMIDQNLLDNLFKGLTNSIKLVLVGDYNQLPSVGSGQVLKDLIESDLIDVISLDVLYRQDENSYIIRLAQEIKDDDISENFLDTRSDYTFLECSTNNIRSNLTNLCKQINDKGYDYKRVQLMAPMYRGINGIDILNKDLQNIFNPSSEEKREIKVGDVIFRENDKILQLVNMPDENIFNGDIGIIKSIVYANTSNSGKNELYIDYDGNIVKYLPKDFIRIKHGFIISIHKSQGSEFEMVIIPMSKSYNRMLYRKLIYTGITRAKRKLVLLGEPELFLYSVHNNNENLRKTNLKERLILMMNNFTK